MGRLINNKQCKIGLTTDTTYVDVLRNNIAHFWYLFM